MLRVHADSIGEDQAALSLLKNLTSIPTLYDKNSDILSQCIRQNVKGTFVKPLTAIQWAHLAVMMHSKGVCLTDTCNFNSQSGSFIF